MRVGLFTDAYLPEISGVTMAVRWYREELEHRGHEVYVYAPRYERAADDDDRTYRFRAGPVFGYKTARMAVPYCREAFRTSYTVTHPSPSPTRRLSPRRGIDCRTSRRITPT